MDNQSEINTSPIEPPLSGIENPTQSDPVPDSVVGATLAPTAEVDPANSSTPEPSIAPEKSLEGDDISSGYVEHRETLSGDAAEARLDSFFESTGAPKAAASEPKKKEEQPLYKSIPLDMMIGAMESPTQAVGGGRDAIQEVIDLAGEVGSFEPPKLPEVSAAKSTTGNIVRGMSQFLTGFYAGGKVLKGVKVGGMLASGIKLGAQGAIADFAAFDGHQHRLSNFIQSIPALKNPVNEFLASDPNDTELQGRLKNAIEGSVVSVVGAATAKAFVKSLEYMRAGNKIKGLVGTAVSEEGDRIASKAMTESDLSVLGDPTGDVIAKKPSLTEENLTEGFAKTEGTQPSDVKGRGKAGDEVYINFSKIDSPESIQTTIKKMANMHAKDIDDAARGTRTWEQTKLSADQQDAWKTLMERRTGEAMNAEQAVASRQLWATSAGKLRETATLASQAPTEANLFAFRKMLATHYAIQKNVIAARTETARALNSWKMPVGDSTAALGQMTNMLEQAGGVEVARDMATKISMLSDAGMSKQLEEFIEKGALATTKDAVSQVWINGLLSNPATHVANAMSNFATAFQQIYERKGAEFISQKLGTENGVALGEAMAMANGMLSSFRDGLEAFGKKVTSAKSPGDILEAVRPQGLEEGTSRLEAGTGGDVAAAGHMAQKYIGGKIDGVMNKVTSSENWDISNNSSIGRAIDMTDYATQTPGRLLQKSDQVFKSLGYRMELHAQATRLATQEFKGAKVDPEAFRTRVAEIIANPPSDVKLASVNAATYNTFQSKPAEVLKKLGDAVQNLPVIGRLLLPFKNTPINIMTYTFERTPLAPMVKTWRADIAAGGARADIAMSRMSTGTMLMQLAMDAAIKGQISGKGPQESGERANWLREGNQPYSFKLPNGTSVSFQRLEPFGSTLAIGADLAEAALNGGAEISNEDFEHAMIASAFTTANLTSSKTYMQGAMEFAGAVSNPKKAISYANRLAGSIVPAGIAGIARAEDPYMRSADNIVDSLRRRIPGLSEGLPLYRNLWGDKQSYQSGKGWAYDMVSPVYLKTAKPEPIGKELDRLGYFPTMPERKTSFNDMYNPTRGGVMVELDGKQYSRLVELAGNGLKLPQAQNLGLKDFLNAVVTNKSPYSAQYNILSDGPEGGKANYLKGWINKYRDAAKKQLISEDDALRTTYGLKKIEKPGKLNLQQSGR